MKPLKAVDVCAGKIIVNLRRQVHVTAAQREAILRLLDNDGRWLRIKMLEASAEFLGQHDILCKGSFDCFDCSSGNITNALRSSIIFAGLILVQ